MARILAAAIVCVLTLGILGCASQHVNAQQSQRFTTDPYNYDLNKYL